MDTDEIIKKSVSGAKWTVMLSSIALPIGYFTNIILGRVSPEALGAYGVLELFVLSVTTFVLFGGNNVIIKYLPEIKNNKRTSFLVSYIAIVFVFAFFLVGLIYLYPNILSFVFLQDISLKQLKYFVIFIPIIILYFVFNYTLNALMEIKTAVIFRRITIIGYFIVFFILFLFYKDLFREHFLIIIWGFSFIFYFILGLLSFYRTIKKIEITSIAKKDFRFYLPKSFWSFAIFVHITSIVYFASDKMDQIFILRYFNIHELGLYYATLQTAMLIRFAPLLIGSVLLPTFSNLLASNEIVLIQKGYQKIIKFITLIVVPAALFCIFFSKEVLSFFGREYIDNYLLLVALACLFSTSSTGMVNNSLIIAKGRTGIYFLGSTITTIFGFILMFFLIRRFGVLGLAIGRGAIVASWQLFSIIVVTMLLGMNIKIPKSYKVGLITILISILLYFAIPIQTILIHTILFLICLSFFLYFANFTKEDFIFIIKKLWK